MSTQIAQICTSHVEHAVQNAPAEILSKLVRGSEMFDVDDGAKAGYEAFMSLKDEQRAWKFDQEIVSLVYAVLNAPIPLSREWRVGFIMEWFGTDANYRTTNGLAKCTTLKDFRDEYETTLAASYL